MIFESVTVFGHTPEKAPPTKPGLSIWFDKDGKIWLGWTGTGELKEWIKGKSIGECLNG